jgi:DNA-binding CsgD family transcriptional regulator
MHRLWLLQASAPRAAVLFDADGPEAARPDFDQWAALWRMGVSEPANRASTFALLARALPIMGDDAFCREVYEEVRHWKNWWGYGAGIGVDAGRGGLALRLGIVDDARQAFEDGMRWAEREGCPIEVGRNLAGLARVADCDGDIPLARSLLDRSVRLFRRLGARLYLDDVLTHRAELQARDSPVDRMDGGGRREGSPASTASRSVSPSGAGRDPSARELEVLRLVATGLRNREIATQLVISERTVERHISNVYRKLDLRGKADATAWALRTGLL